MRLAADLREFVELLRSNEVEFVVVGAVALGFHKLPRYTGDLDLFVRNSRKNAERIVESIRLFGFESLGLTATDFESDDAVVQIGIAPNRIDILTRLSGVGFAEAWEHREEDLLDGIPVAFISASNLIKNKLATGREQDLVDVKALRKRLGQTPE
ncbi:MAG: hypothetical protein HYR64_02655 [Fimbriimonas ginsengisoli]|uniref:DUF6036 domain-containing protein n=1 Tax=Fimbriimonas ginsengisoli TaxID=1005039 RepID=A0A931LRI0_FIMGI|nr:hypothetical protein [Fimbriimonas ginsengisoli]